MENYLNQQIFEKLPEPLKKITAGFSDYEKDVVLLSSLTVMSTCLPNIKGEYKEQDIYPHLYLCKCAMLLYS